MIICDNNNPEPIHCGAIPSPFGTLRVSERGGAIVAITWGAADDAPPSALLAEAGRQIAAYCEDASFVFDLPLHPGGSEFQGAVWRAMRTIPAGCVLTYGEIARQLRSSARAVGGACGANPIALVIPCHRVVSAHGLGGYSGAGGTRTKRALLAHEGALAQLNGLAKHKTRV